MEYAAAKGIGVVVMEPLKGGNISLPVPEPLRDEAREAGYASPNLADLGLRWVWDHPGVSVVLSGMTTPEQLSQNLASADRGRPGGLSDAQRRFADRVWKFFSDRMRVPCTACAYYKTLKSTDDERLIFKLNFDIVKVLNYFASNSLKNFRNITLQQDVESELQDMMRSYISFHMDVGKLKSDKMLNDRI